MGPVSVGTPGDAATELFPDLDENIGSEPSKGFLRRNGYIFKIDKQCHLQIFALFAFCMSICFHVFASSFDSVADRVMSVASVWWHLNTSTNFALNKLGPASSD